MQPAACSAYDCMQVAYSCMQVACYNRMQAACIPSVSNGSLHSITELVTNGLQSLEASLTF